MEASKVRHSEAFETHETLSLMFMISGRGNVAPAVEFNFYRDPESVFIVLESLKGAVTVLPLDVDEFMHITLVTNIFHEIRPSNI